MVEDIKDPRTHHAGNQGVEGHVGDFFRVFADAAHHPPHQNHGQQKSDHHQHTIGFDRDMDQRDFKEDRVHGDQSIRWNWFRESTRTTFGLRSFISCGL